MIFTLKRIFLVVSASIIPVACALASELHAPQTEAEKKVAEILKLDNSITNPFSLFYFLTAYESSPRDKYYTTLFTPSFLAFVRNENQKELNVNCDGKYIEGDECGLEIEPVICSNDISDFYLYHTYRQTENEAIISAFWPNANITEPNSTYRLLKVHGHWMLDATFCSDSGKFNWDNDKSHN